MFGLFKKKPDQSEMFADRQWNIMEGEYEDGPVLVRFNAALKPFAGKTDYKLKIGFAIPLNSPNPGGMPEPEENEQIGPIEDRILEVLQEKGAVVQALAITMGTFKEFVFYAKPGLNVKGAHEQLKAEIQSHEVQCYAETENDWATFKEYG